MNTKLNEGIGRIDLSDLNDSHYVSNSNVIELTENDIKELNKSSLNDLIRACENKPLLTNFKPK